MLSSRSLFQQFLRLVHSSPPSPPTHEQKAFGEDLAQARRCIGQYQVLSEVRVADIVSSMAEGRRRTGCNDESPLPSARPRPRTLVLRHPRRFDRRVLSQHLTTIFFLPLGISSSPFPRLPFLGIEKEE